MMLQEGSFALLDTILTCWSSTHEAFLAGLGTIQFEQRKNDSLCEAGGGGEWGVWATLVFALTFTVTVSH